MQPTADDAQRYIIHELKKCQLASHGYDVYLDTLLDQYLCDIEKVSSVRELDRQHQNNPGPLQLKKEETSKLFHDAAWDLCRLGVLRPGHPHGGAMSSVKGWDGAGYSLTTFGRSWLASYEVSNFLPANPNHYEAIFDRFQEIFGPAYFERIQEAIRCFMAQAYLACCAMCGAAAESILLSVAFEKQEKEQVLKKYLNRNGREEVEKIVFGLEDNYFKREYKNYIQLLKYWRDNAAHGHTAGIKSDEAYIALNTLLRFANFMQDNHEDILAINLLVNDPTKPENSTQKSIK